MVVGWRVDHVLAHVGHVLEIAWRGQGSTQQRNNGHATLSPVCLGNTGLCLAGVGVLSGLLYATGGHDGPLVRKSVEVYDPGTNTWKQVADMNMCRRNAGNHNKSFCGVWLQLSVWFLMQLMC